MIKFTRFPCVETHFEGALEQALELARNEEASYLPGWCGPVLED